MVSPDAYEKGTISVGYDIQEADNWVRYSPRLWPGETRHCKYLFLIEPFKEADIDWHSAFQMRTDDLEDYNYVYVPFSMEIDGSVE